ncbi:type II secretion system F family protein [Paenibacillus koleovorans]|uniref:type II secretion system F family protein n=1 Tax=Paenibacillus koleovorans TaxID=121608 RepID=UPI000FD79CE2|nr:type II secretion system F family protein [Paenibacillus koleovorans]
MPKFRYEAFDDFGRPSKGVLESHSFQTAMEELKGKGLWIVRLFDPGQSILHKEISFGASKVSNAHFTVFCRQLSTLYKSGVNMVEAVRVLSRQAESKPFKKVLQDVAEQMQQGSQFSIACSRHPSVFSTIFINMVRAGETSGNLDDMLDRLAIYSEKEFNTREKVKSAMVYPVIMAIVTIMVVIILMTFVVPRLVGNFAAQGLELPLPTKIVIAISHWMKQYWYILPPIILTPPLALFLLNRNKKGKHFLDYVRLKIPVFGVLWHKQAMSRFSRTFCSLFAAAVPMLQMLNIVASVVGNDVIAKEIRRTREAVGGGASIADQLRGNWLFPPMVVQMIEVGERTGALDAMLLKVAEYYEVEVDAMADRLKSLLEPIMILILAVIVGVIVLAVMLPSFKLMQNMH